VAGLAADPRRDIHIRFELDRSGLLRVLVEHLGSDVSAEQVIERAGAVRRAELASLPAVRLDDATIALAADADDAASPMDAAATPDPETSPPPADGTDDAADDRSELLARATTLLAADTLDAEDRADLERARAAATDAADATATERLAELLYFLDEP